MTSVLRLQARHGRREETRGVPAGACAGFAEGLDTADLDAARALWQMLGKGRSA